ncbi:1359_t:CDS:2 [Paraglomus brasilianum]|uniref:1359_t:CDS:1 n=1 Tax=Paraglomus brasilianum TaxID=144538 RepID=A0A9N9F7D4_9GLOM|nr:1359_t:CDS:2 [Paraglomus brasilianum]
MGQLEVYVVEGKNIRDTDIAADPYVELWFEQNKKKRTEARNNTLTPVWDTRFRFPVNPSSDKILHLRLSDDDVGTDEVIGQVDLDISNIYKDLYEEKWIHLPAKNETSDGEIRLVLEYFP